MLVIRLQRRGRTGLAMYRIVVQDKRTHPTKEKVIARLGSYNPHTKELIVEKELTEKFLSNGAQPSERTASLLKQDGVKLPKWVSAALKKEGKLRNEEKLRKNQPKEEVVEVVEETQVEEATEEKVEETKKEESAEEETPKEA
jgi:small subunit ribosomal protein S16